MDRLLESRRAGRVILRQLESRRAGRLTAEYSSPYPAKAGRSTTADHGCQYSAEAELADHIFSALSKKPLDIPDKCVYYINIGIKRMEEVRSRLFGDPAYRRGRLPERQDRRQKAEVRIQKIEI